MRRAYAALFVLAKVFPMEWFNQENKVTRGIFSKGCILGIDLA